MQIYHNPRCSKSRQTLALLEENGHEPEIILYLEKIPTKTKLKSILKMLDISAEQLIRKGEAIWKSDFKGKKMNQTELIQAMVDHPKLIERPIVIYKGKAALGRPPESVLEIL